MSVIHVSTLDPSGPFQLTSKFRVVLGNGHLKEDNAFSDSVNDEVSRKLGRREPTVL